MAAVAPPVAPDTGAQVRRASAKLREAVLPAAPLEGMPLRRFTLDEYHQLIEIGFLTKNDKLELLDGLLVMRPRISPPHARTNSKLLRLLVLNFKSEKTMVRTRGPVTLPGSDSEPEPNLAIHTGNEVDFWERHPYPDEIRLIAEVSDATLTRDRYYKGKINAHAGIREYWIFNLLDELLEVYRDPHTPAAGDALYQTKLTYHRGDSVAPLAFPDFEVAVDDVLPPATDTA